MNAKDVLLKTKLLSPQKVPSAVIPEEQAIVGAREFIPTDLAQSADVPATPIEGVKAVPVAPISGANTVTASDILKSAKLPTPTPVPSANIPLDIPIAAPKKYSPIKDYLKKGK
jgi:hypothetical protein